VLAKENGASLSTVDPATAGQNGVAAFATTHWSMVLTAQGDSPEADKALEKLCRTYWWPIYGFVRRQGHSPEEAQDLTQGFFAFLLERKGLDTVAPDKGLLRSFFLASVKNFLANARRGYSITRNIVGEPDRPSQAQIAQELGMTENAVRQAFHRLRRRYGDLLRDEIAETVAKPAEIEDELRHFIAVLQNKG